MQAGGELKEGPLKLAFPCLLQNPIEWHSEVRASEASGSSAKRACELIPAQMIV